MELTNQIKIRKNNKHFKKFLKKISQQKLEKYSQMTEKVLFTLRENWKKCSAKMKRTNSTIISHFSPLKFWRKNFSEIKVLLLYQKLLNDERKRFQSLKCLINKLIKLILKENN